jgi:hypothetical protein
MTGKTMDANALYYTFSTIAQTLAGALAVMVAFVVLRLPKLEEMIRDAEDSFARWAGIVPLTDSLVVRHTQSDG